MDPDFVQYHVQHFDEYAVMRKVDAKNDTTEWWKTYIINLMLYIPN